MAYSLQPSLLRPKSLFLALVVDRAPNPSYLYHNPSPSFFHLWATQEIGLNILSTGRFIALHPPPFLPPSMTACSTTPTSSSFSITGLRQEIGIEHPNAKENPYTTLHHKNLGNPPLVVIDVVLPLLFPAGLRVSLTSCLIQPVPSSLHPHRYPHLTSQVSALQSRSRGASCLAAHLLRFPSVRRH